ncbi:MAG: HIRAN domain-containing protein [bacterium]
MDSLTKIDPKLLALIEHSFNNNLPMPFVKEIFLIESQVAGTAYHNLKEIEPYINIADNMVFIREPENQYDNKAIAIMDVKGNRLGYIPKEKNEILANLLDAGKLIFGKLEHKQWLGDWLKLKIKVYLRD